VSQSHIALATVNRPTKPYSAKISVSDMLDKSTTVG